MLKNKNKGNLIETYSDITLLTVIPEWKRKGKVQKQLWVLFPRQFKLHTHCTYKYTSLWAQTGAATFCLSRIRTITSSDKKKKKTTQWLVQAELLSFSVTYHHLHPGLLLLKIYIIHATDRKLTIDIFLISLLPQFIINLFFIICM